MSCLTAPPQINSTPCAPRYFPSQSPGRRTSAASRAKYSREKAKRNVCPSPCCLRSPTVELLQSPRLLINCRSKVRRHNFQGKGFARRNQRRRWCLFGVCIDMECCGNPLSHVTPHIRILLRIKPGQQFQWQNRPTLAFVVLFRGDSFSLHPDRITGEKLRRAQYVGARH